MNRSLLAALLLAGSLASADEGSLTRSRLRMVKAQAATATARETVTGSLFPSKLLPLGFEVGGRLAISRVAKGDLVKLGQLLGSLDTEIIDAQVAQAEAGVAAAEAGSTLATDVAGRTEKLKAEGSVSDVQTKQTDTQAKASLAQLLQAKAGLAQVRAARRRHELKAIFPGTVIDAPDQIGGMVGPGTPVYIIMQLDPLILKGTIPEALRGAVKPGLKVRVEAVGANTVTEDAVVKVVIPSADPQTHRVPVEVVVPNADGRFVANTLAKVTFAVGAAQQAIVIPATALGTMGGEHVFTVDAKGLLKRVPVVVSERAAGQVTVVPTEPVQEVVDYPTQALVDGAAAAVR
jgi:RND family efflux transporter MFP subunit